jgi:hypothetical protein
MLEINNLFTLKATNNELFNYFNKLINEDSLQETFGYLFGGNLFIIESPEELRNIKGVQNFSVDEAVDDYDVAEWTDEGNFAIFALITNNSGGNSYAVPKSIVELFPTVDANIQFHAGE